MKKTFKNLLGEDFDVNFQQHDISAYDVLYHVTLKENRQNIETSHVTLKENRQNIETRNIEI